MRMLGSAKNFWDYRIPYCVLRRREFVTEYGIRNTPYEVFV